MQTIELLGDASSLAAKSGDIIAFGGLKTKEFQKERSFETTLITIIDVNPVGVPPVPETAQDTPKRKAMRMTEGDGVQISWVKNTASSMEQSEAQGVETSPVAFFPEGVFHTPR